MKTILKIVLLSSTILVFLFSCRETKKSVRILVTTRDTSEIRVLVESLLGTEERCLGQARIDSSGKATIEFDLKEPTFADFHVGDEEYSIFLEPGYDLQIAYDPKLEREFSFSGNGSTANNYIDETLKIYQSYTGGKSYWDLTPRQYLARMDSAKASMKNFHTRYCDSTHLSKDISHLLELNNEYIFILHQENYILLQLNKEPDSILLLNQYPEMPFREDMIKYHFPHSIGALHMYMRLSLIRPNDTITKPSRNYRKAIPAKIESVILNDKKYIPVIRELLIAKNISYFLLYDGFTTVLDSLFQNFKKTYPESIYLPPLQKEMDRYTAVSAGKPAPDFSGITLEGTTLSLHDLKGKVVYMDIWATWCRPCREELPSSQKLQKLFAEDDRVIFLYASIDKDQKDWKEMVMADKEFKGVHINEPDGKIMKSYEISGVPTYILIDQDGKIAIPNAPRPSSGDVENEIRKLLRD